MMKKLPKIDLHCHLDGSVRADTIIDIAKKENIKIPSFDRGIIKELIQVPKECTSLNEYLKRFELPNDVMQSSYALERIAFELLEDAAKENIKYIEVRFAPQLHRKNGLSIDDIIQNVLYGIKKAEDIYDIKGNLILGCMRIMSEEDGIEVVNAGLKFLNKGVVAIDLCGPEKEGFANEFKKVTDLAREYGFNITVHAGEAASAKNVIDAINILGATRIGHGVRIKDMREAYDLVKEKGIILEMCPTSNIQTKAIESIEEYPFYNFFKDDIKTTINTDNRTVSNIDLSNEIDLMFNNLEVKDRYKDIYLYTVEATFADEKTKQWLKALI